MLTCKDCVYNKPNLNPQTKEIVRQCTRFPPQMFLLAASNGLVVNVSYPVINNDFISCGEYFDGARNRLC